VPDFRFERSSVAIIGRAIQTLNRAAQAQAKNFLQFASRLRLLVFETRAINVTTANSLRQRRNIMSTIDSQSAGKPATEADQPKVGRKSAKKAKATKKAQGRKADKSERSNKKADVIAMMTRAKGVTLAEIMAATGWQAHTVRGFVSILGSKGGEKIESGKNAAGERTYHITK
jgi:hypothetical protein